MPEWRSGITYVLLDESGNSNTDRPLVVGALVTTALPELEARLSDLFEEERASPELEGFKSFERFKKDGFHYTANPPEVQVGFIKLVSRTHGYRIFMAFSRRARMEKLNDDERSIVLYSTLLTDIILYAQTDEIVFLFETNEGLNDKFQSIVEKAHDRAMSKARGRTLPVASAQVVTKKNPLSMGIIDYCMALFSAWLLKGMAVNPAELSYRSFMRFERNVAVIFNFDDKLRSNRHNRSFH